MIQIETFREKIAVFVAPAIERRLNQLQREADTDALTGLANRNAFTKALPQAEKDNQAFILFDLNNFKLVNKRFLHKAGDELLKRYADVLANVAFKFKCRVFRLGGDEFVIVCHRRFATQIRDAVEYRALPVNFGDFTVSISGVVGTSVEDADLRLQARKIARKNQD